MAAAVTPGPTLSPARWAELDPRVVEADTRGPLDASAPSVARVYDYLCGGKDNFAADRELAEWVLRKSPIVGPLVQANRGFLDGAAGLLAGDAGLRRFLDVGCGLPRSVNVGDVVRRTDPSCRVAYVDNDPMVVAHARALLAVDGRSVAYEGDVRDPVALLGDPELRRLIDPAEPVGVLLVGVLDFIADEDDPRGIVARLADALPPGSHIAITHTERTPELAPISGRSRASRTVFRPRTREEFVEICGCLTMLPGYPERLSLPDAVPSLGRGAGPLPLFACVGRVPERSASRHGPYFVVPDAGRG
jgi:SAM-dependent methyltransferase